MKASDVRATAYSMPLTSPAYPKGPYRFVNREFLVITYRTDPEKLRAVVPEPLQIDEPLVKFEFIRMPDSTGFGDYTESGQVIPVRLGKETGGYSHAMYLNDGPPIFGGRELWGFPKKYAQPSLEVDRDTLVGTLDYGPVRIATGTMGFKHVAVEPGSVLKALAAPNFLLEDHPTRRWQPAHLRACPLRAAGRRAERRVERARRARPAPACARARCSSCPCSRSFRRSTFGPTLHSDLAAWFTTI